MTRILPSIRRFLARDSGHAMVEYLFMISLILVAAILGITAVGNATLDLFEKSRDAMP